MCLDNQRLPGYLTGFFLGLPHIYDVSQNIQVKLATDQLSSAYLLTRSTILLQSPTLQISFCREMACIDFVFLSVFVYVYVCVETNLVFSATALDGHAYKYGGSSEVGCATLGLLTQFYGYPQEVSVFILLNESSKCSSFGVMDDEQFKTMVEEVDNHLPSSSSSQGVYELNDVEEDEWLMVAKKGNQFVINDQPFYVNGFNTYWLMVFAADQSTRGKVTEVFQKASSVGLSVCRTWAFNDGQWRALQKSPGVYDEDVFKALDFVVSEANKYKIRLILSLANNWDAYGGKAQYVKWGKASGLNLTSDDDFFSHPTLRSYYKAHVKATFRPLLQPTFFLCNLISNSED
ncbi:hypothetical protein NC652_037090 [Populus alba x Populus x berolinensis]|nr:hypothetical protein NC652_037090 [Populus alba x Populus x berolinensis]